MLFVRICSGEKIGDLFFVFWILLFIEKPWSTKGVEKLRPDDVLLKVFTRPFAPTENALEKCLNDSDIYLNALKDYKSWALRMYDASVKTAPGLLTGNNIQLGNYDECLRIKTQYGFAGQACNAKIEIAIIEKEDNVINSTNLFVQIARTLNITQSEGEKVIKYEWMWCVPSTCTYADISQTLDQRLDPLRIQDGVLVNITVKVNKVICRSAENDRVVLNIEDWIYTGIILLFLTIILASTIYDLNKRGGSEKFDHKDIQHILLSSFSLYKNGKNLFSIERQGSVIGCLDGLRFFSICWIIFAHTYYMEMAGVKLDLSHIPTMHETWSNLFILNSNIVTDTFFLISAILLAYTLLIRNEKSSDSLSLMHLYAHRYFRLTPTYAMVIGFYATLFYHLGSGPKWDAWVGNNSDYCRKNWWTNLLYINNYINLDATCMSQSWYLSVDMQLVWISPIFLYPMLKLKKKIFFWIILALGFIVSIIVPFLLTFYEKLPGTMLYYKGLADTTKVFVLIYIKTYARAGPYIMGLGLGYLLNKTRCYKIAISRSYVLLGWLLAAAVGFSAVLGPRSLYYSYERIEASFYAGLHRHAFALAVSWIIFASSHGYAGPIGKFLSWRVWIPFSRLTYSAYLCHYIVLLYYSGTVRTSENLTTMNVLRTFFGNLIMALFISLIVCLCFEMPFLTLDRALNRKKTNFSDKSRTRELYKSKSVDDSITSISQMGTNINIPKGSIETMCNSVDDDSFCDEEKNTLRVSIYNELSKSQRDRDCGTNGSKI